jgi:hypothetical protein
LFSSLQQNKLSEKQQQETHTHTHILPIERKENPSTQKLKLIAT